MVTEFLNRLPKLILGKSWEYVSHRHGADPTDSYTADFTPYDSKLLHMKAQHRSTGNQWYVPSVEYYTVLNL